MIEKCIIQYIFIVFVLRILVTGTSHGWFKKINTRIHVDQILEACALECSKLERLEIQWDEETLRWNENSSKFIDHIRYRDISNILF